MLDDNLVRSFADTIGDFFKSKTDSLKVNKETTHYGTVLSNDENGCMVQLDGSSTATPASLLVEVAVGDRVTVSIKNRHATVTGNVTAPSMVMDIGRPGSYRVHVDGDEVTFLDGDGNELASMKIQSSSLGNVLFLLAEKIGLRASRTGNSWVAELIAKHGSDNNPQAALQVRDTTAGSTSYSGVYVSKNKVDVTATNGFAVNGSKSVLENNILVTGTIKATGTIQPAGTLQNHIQHQANVPAGYKLAGISSITHNFAGKDIVVSGFEINAFPQIANNLIAVYLDNISSTSHNVTVTVKWFAVRASSVTEQPVQEIVF